MKAQELRIGSWYNIGYGPFNNIKVRYDKPLDFIDMFHESILERADPIPLTEEWLVKLGFQKSEHENGPIWWKSSRNHKELKLYDKGVGEFMFGLINRWIGTVHDLQNAWREVTDEELTITE